MKTCTRCGNEYPATADHFRRNARYADGLSSWCKGCHVEYTRLWKAEQRATNPDFVERERATRRKSYHTNEASREQMKARAYAWLKEHPEVRQVIDANRRARKKANGGNITSHEWKALRTAYGGVCLCCGTTENLSLDHVMPLALGGENRIRNAQPLCRSCNSSKQDRHIDYRPDQGKMAARIQEHFDLQFRRRV